MNLLSIIIPVFNEAKRLDKTFAAIKELLVNPLFPNLEIIFVDDGSVDETMTRLEDFCKDRQNIRIIFYKPNRGKGYAVRQGMLAAKGDYCLMLDADMSTTFSELEKMAPFMKRGCPVIIGTRKAEGAKLTRRQPWYRQKLGEGYTFFANIITGVWVSDFTCGFKCFSIEAVRKIFPQTKIDRWSYDAETLFLAKKFGLKICEAPVIWHNDENTRVRLIKDIWSSFIDLIKIRLIHR